MSVQPAELDLEIFQVAYWSQQILWEDSDGNPVNLAGYTARMQIRKKVTSADELIEITDGAGITLGLVEDPPGTPLYNILLELTAAQTAALPATPFDRRWFYDLELVPAGGQVRRLSMGRAIVSPEVTR